ncbi:PHP domain-containing protein [Lysinibacillus sp. KU-BSD001]|uniref:PHP domain-containing protein n=1 Tax=Lysinibacillus sp. KU-BSD001 TaxID=3141328 RepID=UPI0036E56C54
MKIDLHTHSRYSDGSETLEQLFQQAKAAGITHLGVVDHDTTAHHAEGRQLAAQYNIVFIAGVEISAYDFQRQRKVHMLGYGFQGECPHIQALCAPLLARRHAHSLWQVGRIQEAGFALDKEQALAFARESGTLYKQHIMNALTEEAYDAKNYQTLYRSLFKQAGVAAGDIRYVDAFDALRAIHADGGVAVLAHPGQLDSFDIAEELVQEGLDGIELIHPDHTPLHMERVQQLADKYQLVTTGGSDYHGRYGASVQLGHYTIPHLQKPAFVK